MFPLPLTCLEEYMFSDDRPSHPMSGVFRLRFDGQLDREALEAAVDVVVRRHALLRATVRRNGWRRPIWIDHPDWRPVVEWQARTNSYGFPNSGYIDLTEQPGTRVWVTEHPGGHDLILQAHHACADALGMTRVIEDLLIDYARRTGETSSEAVLPELDLKRFEQRGAPGLTIGRVVKTARKQAVGLHGVWQFLSRRPVPLVPAAEEIDESVPPPAYPCSRRHDFSAVETRSIIAASKALGVTVNDLLTRDLLLALTAWRRGRSFGGERDWLRIMVPINLRRAEDMLMPMANSVSSVFLDRQPDDCADADQLLAGINKQMNLIKRLELQYTFLFSLGLKRLMPGRLDRKAKCETSCCLSNLGPVLGCLPLPRREGRLVAGDVVLEAVDYVIPLRPFIDTSFCVYTYAGRLSVLMHPNPRTLADADAKELLSSFLEGVRRSAGMAG